jgi:hypothetical protein
LDKPTGGILRKHIKTHWTGRTDFIWLIAINLFAVHIAIHLIGGLAHGIAIWNILFPLIAIILIWQIVGTIRAALYGLDHPDGIFKIIALFGALMVVTISTFWQVNDQYHRLYDPPPPPFIDPAIIELPRSVDGTEITLTGPINLKQYNAFRDIIDVNKLRRVVLDSQGGNIFAARGFHRLIVERGLDTHVTTDCFSACTIIFIAGENRTAETSARFGFHAYAYHHGHTGQQIDVSVEQAKDITLFSRLNTPATFVTKIFATPADDMWHPSHAELRRANILN